MISLVSAVVREIAKALVVAWLSDCIEIHQAQPREAIYYFTSDEFGNIFKTLGWENRRTIEVIIRRQSDND